MRTLARECFAGLDASGREAVLQFLASALTESSDNSLRAELASLREMLRERLPGCGPPGDTRQCVYVDALHAIGDRSFWIRGWLFDGESPATSLRLVSPEGAYVELLPEAFRYPREDLAELFDATPNDDRVRRGAFSAFFELNAPSAFADGWIAELHSASAGPVESPVPAVSRQGAEEAILNVLAHSASETLFEDHISPALGRLRKWQSATLRIESVAEYGEPPTSPVASIVVPMADGTGFLEQQLALFSNDPEMRETDLIYVTSAAEVANDAARLCRLYPVPFRLVRLSQEAARADAANAAATVARSRLFVLFGPTIFPDRAGWLGAMLQYSSMTPQLGDCLIVERERYLSAGGLGSHYLTSQYSTADLRRRLVRSSRKQRPRVEATLHCLDMLMHSEAVTNAREYDAWIFRRIWGEALEL